MSKYISDNDPFAGLFNEFINYPNGVGSVVTTQIQKATSDVPVLYGYGFNFLYSENLETFSAAVPLMPAMASVSHLGPAIAGLIRLMEYGNTDQILTSISALQDAIITAKAANTTDYWNTKMQLDDGTNPYSIYTDKMVKMINYGLTRASQFLEDANSDPEGVLTEEYFQNNFLFGKYEGKYPNFNEVTNGTFSITNLVGNHGLYLFLNERAKVDWEKAAFFFSGSFGRITGGYTVETLPFSYTLMKAGRLSMEDLRSRSSVALFSGTPFTTSSTQTELESASTMAKWYYANQNFNIGLGKTMFSRLATDGKVETSTYPADMQNPTTSDAFSARLKFALENPLMLLATFTSDYVIDQLSENDWQINEKLIIPGLTDQEYPELN